MISEEKVAATVQAVRDSVDSSSMGMYKHPLYVGFPLPEEISKLGENFKHFTLERVVRHKLEIRAEALSRRQFDRYVFIGTERPFRLEALLFLVNASYVDTDSVEFNHLLRDTWVDCEHPNVNDEHWRMLFALADNEKILTDDGKQAWRNMFKAAKMTDGQVVDIYRGTTLEELSVGRKALGLSWTTDFKTAVWFANRWKTSDRRPVVLKQRVDVGDLIGPFTCRGEHEVILLDPVKGIDFTAFHPKEGDHE